MRSSSVLSSAAVNIPAKPLYRWLLALFMMAVIAVGWRYPVLGFAVPAAMLAGMGGGFFKGRYVCGNFCPRGSFYDTVFSFFGGQRAVPSLFLNATFRWGVMAVLMSFMVWRIAQNPGDWQHWGSVFWSMCLITTAVGLPLGMIYRSRSWCSFCPVGTVASAVGGHTYQLQISHDCRQCGICESSCPMGLSIAEHRDQGALPHRDCIKCSSCADTCPKGALNWPA
jgi:polyferredoxin